MKPLVYFFLLDFIKMEWNVNIKSLKGYLKKVCHFFLKFFYNKKNDIVHSIKNECKYT